MNEAKIRAKGPEKVTFKELVTVAIKRLKDPGTSLIKKERAARGLLNMAAALDMYKDEDDQSRKGAANAAS
tara:strand:+ start:43 stop:255 length:213 start_codon:yes stop_codon:yes gene_type:complete